MKISWLQESLIVLQVALKRRITGLDKYQRLTKPWWSLLVQWHNRVHVAAGPHDCEYTEGSWALHWYNNGFCIGHLSGRDYFLLLWWTRCLFCALVWHVFLHLKLDRILGGITEKLEQPWKRQTVNASENCMVDDVQYTEGKIQDYCMQQILAL